MGCCIFFLRSVDWLDVARELFLSKALVYAVSACANEIKEFRCRFVQGEPVEFERIDTAFTYLDKETELFKVVNVRMQDTLDEYVALAERAVREQKENFTAPLSNDVFQFSAFP